MTEGIHNDFITCNANSKARVGSLQDYIYMYMFTRRHVCMHIYS